MFSVHLKKRLCWIKTKTDSTQNTNRNEDTNTKNDKNKDKEYSPEEALVLEGDCLEKNIRGGFSTNQFGWKPKVWLKMQKNESFVVWIILGGSYLINSSFGAEEKLRELFFEVSFVGDKMFKGGIWGRELGNIIPATQNA